MAVSEKKCLLPALILIIFSLPLSAIDLGFRLTPVASIPTGSESTSVFTVGAGAFLNAEVELMGRFAVGPEIGVYVNPLDGPSSTVQFVALGMNVSTFYFPFSRVSVRASATFGAYESISEFSTYLHMWWKGYAEAGFRFSPRVTVSAGAGYINFMQKKPGPLYAGILAGLSGHIAIDTKPSEGSITVSLEQPDPVFPLFAGMYRENGIGTLSIMNNESAEIRNVTVNFTAGNYSASLMNCGTVEVLRKRKSVDIPLYADFAPSILNFTEDGKMPGEILVSYELLGSSRTISVPVVVSVFNRNSIRWTDASALAAYVSPNAPEVLDLSKYLVGIGRNQLRSGLNRNMQFAAYLYEGLRIGGLSWSEDKTTPYNEYHRDPQYLDYIQYPFQTLAYRSGDYDDMGLLYTALLESVGIKAAFIPLPDDFLVLFSLDITPDDAAVLFDSSDRYLVLGDEVWLPVCFSVFREGFVNSWYYALQLLEPVLQGEQDAEVVVLRDAWTVYPPAGIIGREAQFEKPEEDTVIRAVETVMMRYITAEFGPRIKQVQNRIRAEGGSVARYNELGLLFVRAGLYAEAKAEFTRSAGMGSATAMINLGNIAMLERDYTAALDWFSQADAAEPGNRAAKSGMERARVELDVMR